MTDNVSLPDPQAGYFLVKVLLTGPRYDPIFRTLVGTNAVSKVIKASDEDKLKLFGYTGFDTIHYARKHDMPIYLDSDIDLVHESQIQELLADGFINYFIEEKKYKKLTKQGVKHEQKQTT